MKLVRREFLRLSALGVALPLLPPRAFAENYPSRPVHFVVGFPAGGPNDILGRLIAQWLSDRLGQPFAVENKPGTSGNVATEMVVRAPADGYTILLVGPANAISGSLYPDLSFNFLRDIAPVAALAELPFVLEVNPSLPAKSVAEFIAYAKANPGKINMASFGAGTISHLAGELFKVMTGVSMLHVPYRGGAPMVTDIIGGRVQAGIDALPNSLPHIQSGAMRALAITGPTRSDVLPDVPTVGETVPGYDVSGWTGVGVPSGTPAEIVATLNREINAALSNPRIKARLAEIGGRPMLLTPDEMGKLWVTDTERWAKVVKFAGVKAE